ncbi:unnamed protein product, partial [marine sediment metagenome]
FLSLPREERTKLYLYEEMQRARQENNNKREARMRKQEELKLKEGRMVKNHG